MNLFVRATALAVAVGVALASVAFCADVLRPRASFNPRFEKRGGSFQTVVAAPGGGCYLGGEFSSVDGASEPHLARFLASGGVDPAFTAAAISGGKVLALAVQADGKVLVGGDFTRVAGVLRRGLARLNSDGSLDASFDPGDGFEVIAGSTMRAEIRAITLQTDGRLLVGGMFGLFDGVVRDRIARLHPDGTLDATFDPRPGAAAALNGSVHAIAVMADGKVAVGGSFSSFNNVDGYGLARLNADGSRDLTFVTGFGVLGPSGSAGYVATLLANDDGTLYVGGEFKTYQGVSRTGFMRVLANGAADPAYTLDAATAIPAGYAVLSARRQADDKIVIAGSFVSFGGVARSRLARLNADGSHDTTFDPGFTFGYGPYPAASFRAVAPLADGTLVAAGTFPEAGTPIDARAARFSATGTHDATFAPAVLMPGIVKALVRDSQNRWIVGGEFAFVDGQPRGRLARLAADGTLDPSYATGVDTGFDGLVHTLALGAGDTVYVGGDFDHWGSTTSSGLARFTAAGALDPGFAPVAGFGRPVHAILEAPDGNVFVGGSFATFQASLQTYLVKVSATGTLDTSYHAGGAINGPVVSLLLQADGKLVAGLRSVESNSAMFPRKGIARFNVDGSPDGTFGGSSFSGFFANGFPGIVDGLLAGPNNTIYAVGYFDSYFANGVSTSCKSIARLSSDGLLDPGFTIGAGFAGLTATVADLIDSPDGQLLAAGAFSTYQAGGNPAIARLAHDGEVDLTFTTPTWISDGVSGPAAIAYDAAGNLVAAGGWQGFRDGFTGGGIVLFEPAPVPVIDTPPQEQIAAPGGSANFSVTASGPDLTYQWYRDGESIAGATSTTLALTDLAWDDAGAYTVAVANAYAIVTSAPVLLRGPNPAPTITTQPSQTDAIAGTNATLTVAASGTGPLSYHWRHAGDEVPNTTGATLTLPGVALHQAGWYDVVVADGLSVTTSQAARVFVRPTRYSNAYRVEPSFAPRFELPGGSVSLIAIAPEGSFYLAGSFTSVGDNVNPNLARFLADGSPDPAFRAPYVESGVVTTVVPLADGRLLLGGSFRKVGDLPRRGIARLNADGSIDPTFDPGTGFTHLNNADTAINTLAVQADGRIIAGGYFDYVDGHESGRIARLNADGSYDTSFVVGAGFDAEVKVVALQSDGRVIAAGAFANHNGVATAGLVRLATTGARDATFVAPSLGAYGPTQLVVQPDDRLLVAGEIQLNGGGVTRLLANGTVDATFNAGTLPDGPVRAVALLPDGRVIVGGRFTTFNGSGRGGIALLTSAGALEATFGAPAGFARTGGQPTVASIVRQADGRLLVAGFFTSFGGIARDNLARLEVNGALEPTFAPAPRLGGEVATIKPVGGGRWEVAGYFQFVNGTPRPDVARLNADGSLDTTFVPLATDDPLRAAYAVRPDGRMWVSSPFDPNSPRTTGLGRAFRDGRRDPSFEVGTGLTHTYTTGGTLPQQITTSGEVHQMQPTADGGVLVTGAFSTYDGTHRGGIARIGPTGLLDATFAAGMGFYWSSGGAGYGRVYQADVLADGRIVALGFFQTYDGVARKSLARLTASGALDAGFVPDETFNFANEPLLTQGDHRVVASGFATGGIPEYLVRLDETGAFDATFAVHGARGHRLPRGLAWREDGAIMAAGPWMEFDGFIAGGLALLVPTDPLPPEIRTAPQSQITSAGGATTLTVEATGSGVLFYQWQQLVAGNGPLGAAPLADTWVDIAGATDASYTIPSTQTFHGGTYRVVVTAGGLSTTSDPVTVAVDPPAPSNARLLNLSTRGLSAIAPDILIPGFVISGTQDKRLLIRAVGPTLALAPIELAGTLIADPQLTLKKYNFTTEAYEDLASNDDWGTNANAAAIATTAADLFAFELKDAKEAALLMDLAPGQYTVHAGDKANATGLAIVELYDADASGAGSRLINISNRGYAGTGDQAMIPGFVVSNEGPKTLLVRVVGPTLAGAPYNVPGTMADPKLTIYSGQTAILENDNWGDNPDAATTASVAQQLSAFALDAGSADAAFVVTLQPGVYTVVGSSADGTGTGVVLVEVYVVP